MRIREETKRAEEEAKNPHHELIDSILNSDDLEPDDNPSENSVEIANRDYINNDRRRGRPEYPNNGGGNGGNGGFPSG